MKKYVALMAACLTSISALAADEILIGQTADFSVAGAQMKEFNAGAMAYISKVNGSGGVKGKQIKLISLDDGYVADKAAQNAKELIYAQKVSALFGIRGTDPTEAVMKVAEAAGVPVIAPVTGADSVRKSPETFPVRASYRCEIEAMLHHIAFMPTRSRCWSRTTSSACPWPASSRSAWPRSTRARTASISASGMPQRPKPPKAIIYPSLRMSAMAISALA